MDECLDEQTILAFGRGQIAPDERRPIEKHIATCDECRALVSAVARSSFVDPQELLGAPPSEGSRAAAPAEAPAQAADPPLAMPLAMPREKPEIAKPLPNDPSPTRATKSFDKRIAIGLLVLLALLIAVGAMINASRV